VYIAVWARRKIPGSVFGLLISVCHRRKSALYRGIYFRPDGK